MGSVDQYAGELGLRAAQLMRHFWQGCTSPGFHAQHHMPGVASTTVQILGKWHGEKDLVRAPLDGLMLNPNRKAVDHSHVSSPRVRRKGTGS